MTPSTYEDEYTVIECPFCHRCALPLGGECFGCGCTVTDDYKVVRETMSWKAQTTPHSGRRARV